MTKIAECDYNILLATHDTPRAMAEARRVGMLNITAPFLSNKSAETDESDETYLKVTNDEFLTAVFGDLIGEQRPVVCGFPGHPSQGSKARWFGRPWLFGKMFFHSEFNHYFTLSSFKPDVEGKYRRQKKNFIALHAIMLDDLGTKAAEVERLTLPPSWILETSPDNYQAGYILSSPLADKVIAERVMKAIIAAGLCDPGADGPLARYARLPVGINGKHNPFFACCLREFCPDRRYTVEQITDGLELDFDQHNERRTQRPADASKKQRAADEDTYVPRHDENPVIAQLKEKGLYLQPLGDSKHEIHCPWQHEHTDGAGGGTAYFEPSEFFPIGGFKCLHGHCAHRHMRNLREFLGISKTEAKHRPTIRVTGGELAQIVDHCEQELANAGRYYQRGGLLVNVITDPGTKETIISPLALSSVARALSGLACFERYDRRMDAWVDCDPPERHCKTLFDASSYPHMPVLQGISRQPYLRPDGSLMTEPGYDPATQMYGLFNSGEFSVPDEPAKLDAANALKVIDNLLDEFSFKTLFDKVAAISAILTAAIRPSLTVAPMFHCCAPQISSGKSYLTSLITAFASERAASGIAFPHDDDECRKLLLASLLTSPAVICFDNLTTDLVPHKSLCSVLTEEYITGRILGGSKTATVGTRTLFLSSGNNVRPVRDMTRRTVSINLYPACEIPAARTFNKQPVALVLQQRGYYVSQALTVIRAWIVAGKPVTEVKPLASYSDWSSLCRQPLLWLGYPDPTTNVFSSMEDDPDRELLSNLLHAWYHLYGSFPNMIREVVNSGDAGLQQAIEEIALDRGTINRRRLGKWISRHAGRIVDGLQFEKDTGTRSAEAWLVKSVS